MKRSEMLDLIVSELARAQSSHYALIAHAKTLLDKIEKAGMLAPCRADFGGHGKIDSEEEAITRAVAETQAELNAEITPKDNHLTRPAEESRRVFIRESAGGNLTSGWSLNTCDTDDVEFDLGHPGGRWVEFTEVPLAAAQADLSKIANLDLIEGLLFNDGHTLAAKQISALRKALAVTRPVGDKDV